MSADSTEIAGVGLLVTTALGTATLVRRSGVAVNRGRVVLGRILRRVMVASDAEAVRAAQRERRHRSSSE